MPKRALSDTYSAVADKVLKETLRLRPGESITIETWTGGLPFATEVALKARMLGAFPIVTYEHEKNYVKGIRSSPKDALGKMGKHEYGLIANSDAYVFIPGPPIAGYYPKITRKEFIDSTSYNGSWYQAAKKSKLRGARLTHGYIGSDLARLLDHEVDEIVEHQLNAASANLNAIRTKAKSLSKALTDGAAAVLTTAAGELKMKLKGSLEIQDGITDPDDVAGGENMSYMPPGYVAKDVQASSVSGSVALSPSITRFGLLKDANVSYKKGKFVEWSSKNSRDVLKELETVLPEKARLPAYIILGLNPQMKFGYGQDRFPKGSITVGMGIAGIVRKGTLTVDGKPLVKDGRLL